VITLRLKETDHIIQMITTKPESTPYQYYFINPFCELQNIKFSKFQFQIVERPRGPPHEHGRLRQAQHPASVPHRNRINILSVFLTTTKTESNAIMERRRTKTERNERRSEKN
jgi:hypothetical protein